MSSARPGTKQKGQNIEAYALYTLQRFVRCMSHWRCVDDWRIMACTCVLDDLSFQPLVEYFYALSDETS